MRLRSLKQLLDIVKAMARPRQITVLGSSSLLAGNPDLGEKGRPLELSLDADMLVEPCDSGQAAVLHEAIGEGSLFHREYGVYADFMRPDILETFPVGWEKRCVVLGRDRSVRCLNPIDLAIMKLKAGYGAALGAPPVGRESRAKYGRATPGSVVRKSSRAKPRTRI